MTLVGRVACETFVTTGLVLVGGEITTSTYVDIEQIVRSKIQEIGYNNPNYGFDGSCCAVISSIIKQSPDIPLVNEKLSKKSASVIK